MCNCFIIKLGNNFFNILNDIKLPLAPVFTLYTMQVNLWLVIDYSLVNITDFTLSRLIYFTLIKLKLLSCSSGSSTCRSSSWPISCIIFLPCQSCCSSSHTDLHTTFKWFWFLHPLHFLPYAGHCLKGCLVPHYLQLFTSFI